MAGLDDMPVPARRARSTSREAMSAAGDRVPGGGVSPQAIVGGAMSAAGDRIPGGGVSPQAIVGGAMSAAGDRIPGGGVSPQAIVPEAA
jgi:hypothetical protein